MDESCQLSLSAPDRHSAGSIDPRDPSCRYSYLKWHLVLGCCLACALTHCHLTRSVRVHKIRPLAEPRDIWQSPTLRSLDLLQSTHDTLSLDKVAYLPYHQLCSYHPLNWFSISWTLARAASILISPRNRDSSQMLMERLLVICWILISCQYKRSCHL